MKKVPANLATSLFAGGVTNSGRFGVIEGQFARQPDFSGVISNQEDAGADRLAKPIMIHQTGPEGFEPSTYGLEIRCSIQLSYEPHTVANSLTALRNVEKR